MALGAGGHIHLTLACSQGSAPDMKRPAPDRTLLPTSAMVGHRGMVQALSSIYAER